MSLKLKRVTKLLISIAFLGMASLWNLLRRPRVEVVILYYHAVPARQRRRFAHQMDMLIRLTTPVKLDFDTSFARETRYSGVTFDDGFRSVAENAIPELEKRDIPATIFVTTGRLGRSPDWWPDSAEDERNEPLLSAEQLQRLPMDLITIGSHTLTHPTLPSLTEQEARRQLYESRAQLECLLNRRITLVSFPFGAFNNQLVRWCREAGYQRVFTSLPLLAFRTPGEFVVGRVATSPTDWPLEFRLKLMGAYRWLPYAIAFKRWLSQIR